MLYYNISGLWCELGYAVDECQQHERCVDRALSRAESLSRKRKLRFTPVRRRVLEIVWESHRPSKAYDVLAKLRKIMPSAKPPTVYRALDFLLANGLVHKLGSLHAYVGCSHPLRHCECSFLICSKCNAIKECCNGVLRHAIVTTAGKNRFLLGKSTLEIGGECRDCMSRGTRRAGAALQ